MNNANKIPYNDFGRIVSTTRCTVWVIGRESDVSFQIQQSTCPGLAARIGRSWSGLFDNARFDDLPEDDPAIVKACAIAHSTGPIGALLNAMSEPGYWEQPGPGYYPKYFSTVWSICLLAQLGADTRQDERIQRACQYYLDQALTPIGQISASGTSSGTVDCLQGNSCWALTVLGFQDERLDFAYEWMARSVTGDGIAPMKDKDAEVRYYAGKCGPLFACGSNDKHSCAWGAVKILLALAALPQDRRTPLINAAINAGVDFIFSTDPAGADYPHPYSAKTSGNWWKFGFPVFYITDLLQLVEAMVGLGYGRDPRLASAIQIIKDKQDFNGRWLLEYDYQGKIKLDLGTKKVPNKWVTIRALRVLKAVEN